MELWIGEATATDEVGVAEQNGSQERRDVGGVELAVGVHVDHHIRSSLERRPHAGSKGSTDAPVVGVGTHLGAVLPGQISGGIGRAVVDDDDLYIANALEVTRDSLDHIRDGRFLVEGGE